MENNIELEVQLTLKEELERVWDEKRAESFIESIKEKIDKDQFECLEKMVVYITEETPNITEEMLVEISENLDTFDGALDFLSYFFKMTQPELVDEIMEDLSSDPEEIIDLLETMEDQGIIQYLAEFGSFYVWFR